MPNITHSFLFFVYISHLTYFFSLFFLQQIDSTDVRDKGILSLFAFTLSSFCFYLRGCLVNEMIVLSCYLLSVDENSNGLSTHDSFSNNNQGNVCLNDLSHLTVFLLLMYKINGLMKQVYGKEPL